MRDDDDKILKYLASPSMLSTGSVMLAGLGGAGPLSFPEQSEIEGNDDDHDDDDHDDDDDNADAWYLGVPDLHHSPRPFFTYQASITHHTCVTQKKYKKK